MSLSKRPIEQKKVVLRVLCICEKQEYLKKQLSNNKLRNSPSIEILNKVSKVYFTNKFYAIHINFALGTLSIPANPLSSSECFLPRRNSITEGTVMPEQ